MTEVIMKEKKNTLYFSAFILYLNYFIHGIGVSVLGQQVIKESLAIQWGTTDDRITMIAAALGLGRLITLPFSGPISDKLGRRICTLIGICSYIIFFGGIALSPNMQVAYVAAILGGVANSFLDTGVIPACVEILYPKSGLATMFTKLFISIAQLILPITLGIVVGNALPINSIFYGCAVILLIVGIITIKIPMPKQKDVGSGKNTFFENIKKVKLTKESFALIAIGFTCTATFQLWLNCAQKFGSEVAGMENVARMQIYYSIGTLVAIALTSFLVTKVKEIRFLVVYPLISLVMILLVYMIKTPTICLVGSFVIGYSAAGGVLQLATATVNDLFPSIKGTITSIIMIASSLSNYTVLSLAGKMSESYGPGSVLLLNAAITLIGILFALLVNKNYKVLEQNAKEA